MSRHTQVQQDFGAVSWQRLEILSLVLIINSGHMISLLRPPPQSEAWLLPEHAGCLLQALD